MSLDSPNKAVLWRCWRLSWRPALACLLGLFALLVPMLVFFVDRSDPEEVNGLINSFMFAYLFFLWGSTLRMISNVNQSKASGGYQLVFELAQPLSLAHLVVLPLIYQLLMFTVAYLIPGLGLQWLFAFEGPSVTGILVIFETVLMVSALIWWSNDPVDGFVAWIVFSLLLIAGWLYPEFGLPAEEALIAGLSTAGVLQYLAVIAGSVALVVIGVGRQRYGENLLALSQRSWLNSQTGLFRLLTLPFLKTSCPTETPEQAEKWRLRRFRGISNYLLYGLGAGLFPPILLGSIHYFNPESEPIPLGALIGMTCGPLFMVAIATAQPFFGLASNGQSVEFSLFNRVRPLPTATLTWLNTLVLFTGMLTAAAGVFITLQLFGPALIPDFTTQNQQFFSVATSFISAAPLRASFWLLTGPAFVLCVPILFSAFIAWCALQPKRAAAVSMGFPAYVLLVVLSLTVFDLPGRLGVSPAEILLTHLWLVVFLVPVGIVYFYRQVQKDWMLDKPILLRLGGAALILAGLFMWQVDLSFIGVDGSLDLMTQALEISLAFIPLFTSLLALLTMNRVIHQ